MIIGIGPENSGQYLEVLDPGYNLRVDDAAVDVPVPRVVAGILPLELLHDVQVHRYRPVAVGVGRDPVPRLVGLRERLGGDLPGRRHDAVEVGPVEVRFRDRGGPC